jgi:outer membrane protein
MALKQGKEFQISQKNLEASKANYSSKKLSFYLPKLSLNSNLPNYDVNENLFYSGGFGNRIFTKDRTLSYYNAISLSQDFFTGGNLQVDGFVNSYDQRYQTFFENGDTIPERKTQEVLTNVGFRFTQPIMFWSSPNRLELDKSKVEYQLAQKDYAEKVNGLISELTSTYFDLLITQREVLIAEKKLESSQIVLENVKKMQAEGIKSDEEVYNAEKEFLNNKINLIDQNGKIRELENVFLQKTNLKTDVKIELLDKFDNVTLSSDDSNLLQKSVDNSASALKAELEVKSKEIALHQQQAAGGIIGNFEATYGLWGRGDQISSSWDDLRRNRWGVNVNLSIPIWDGGARDASLRSLQLSLEEAQNKLELTRKTVRLNLETVINKLNNLDQKDSLLLKEKGLASKKLENSQDKHKMGLISEKELLDAEVGYLETEKSYLENLKEFYLQKIELKKIWGVLPESE